MVLYGDSHAIMWLPAFIDIARRQHSDLVLLAKSYCPAEPITIANYYRTGPPNSPFTECTEWHNFAIDWIAAHHPNVLVISQANNYTRPNPTGATSVAFTSAQWASGLEDLYALVPAKVRTVFMSGIPRIGLSPPDCMAAHQGDIRTCSTPVQRATLPLDATERTVTAGTRISYLDVTPWFCSQLCTPVVDRYGIYRDDNHITATWAQFLPARAR